MKSLWKDSLAKGKDSLDQLVYRSRLIGQDAKLCVWGGGNTSTKRTERDHLGRQTRVLWVKGSGSDLKASERKHFSPLRLDDLLALLKRSEMSDEEMVDLLTKSLLDPKAPRPSIEALLHAFLPFQDIDHSHADAILSVTNTQRGQAIAKKIYGHSLIWIPYIKPGFLLSKKMVEAYKKHPQAQGAILEKHGLITWGNSSKESYTRMIHFVSLAEQHIAKAARGKKVFGRSVARSLSESQAQAWLAQFLPRIRKVVSAHKRVVFQTVSTPQALEFVNSQNAHRVSQLGPATPDHMLRTKRVPLFIETKDITTLTANDLEHQLQRFARAHESYFNRFKKPAMTMLDPYPRVILLPGIGFVATGKDKDSAIQCAEVYEHSIATMRGAEALDQYESLSLPLAFEMEYWSLELYKLSLAPAEKPLARRVALVTGACGSIGRAIVTRLLKEGAHVVIADLDLQKTKTFSSELNRQFGVGRTLGVAMDVRQEKSVQKAFEQLLLTYGGLDLVVSNAGIAKIGAVESLHLSDWQHQFEVNATGHFLVAREAMQIFKRQGLGGNLVFIATKNVTAPGKEFGAYSASKSAQAQLARICAIEGGEWGVRSNMVNPDGIFEGSGLWSKEVRSDRAKSYGISPKQIEKFYQNRNLLKAQVRSEDVASAVVFLASEESARTTGAMIPVDGGLREAFPR
jgi:rhamnulose-1-phosphate aldolase/alcohol dehydrogenase